MWYEDISTWKAIVVEIVDNIRNGRHIQPTNNKEVVYVAAIADERTEERIVGINKNLLPHHAM